MIGHIEEMLITINTVVHRDTKLMVATSPELRGLIVHARSESELDERIPQAIRALLEAEGHSVSSIEPVVEEGTPSAFVPMTRRFQARAA
ncbi:MAG: hypothetical protein VW338_00945 [Rhodospirillaceae bacterium]